jgi:DNA-binding response OmpR family regulator
MPMPRPRKAAGLPSLAIRSSIFPRRRPHRQIETPMNTPALSATSEPTRRKRLLIVDDDDAVRSGLEEILVKEGYEVVTACNGIQALAILRRQPCDLALIDLNMPLLNGRGTIAELRRLNRWLPIVIITARPDHGTRARESGVELMEKPLDLPLLVRRIGDLLATSHETTRALPGKAVA